MPSSKRKSFTLIELLVILLILFLLLGFTLIYFRFSQKESRLTTIFEEFVSVLTLAQKKTISSHEGGRWGVYITTSTSPHQFILFKGNSFSTRETSFDKKYFLPPDVEFSKIELDGQNEVVFKKITGESEQTGKISLRLKNNPSYEKSVLIENFGIIKPATTSFPSDFDRIKDSRHVHFDYIDFIETSTEKLILTLRDGNLTVQKEIVITENLKENQIFWEGEIEIGGNIQKIKIHTHWLNDPISKTRFCIHRDRRFNNKALKVEISGDTGSLIEYTDDGQTTKGTSIFVSEPSWQ